jgi:hypothetical protein
MMMCALVSIVNVAVMVVIRGTEPENHADTVVIIPGQFFVLQKIFDLIVGILDEKTAVLIDSKYTEPTVTGAYQMIRCRIYRDRLSCPDKHIPEGAKTFLFCF